MNPFLMIGGAIIGIAAAFAYTHYQRFHSNQRHEYHNEQPLPRTDIARREVMRILGPCGKCHGKVSTLNGSQLNEPPCNHFIHNTCRAHIMDLYPEGGFRWTDVCDACLKERLAQYLPKEETTRQRKPVCANCQLPFDDQQNNNDMRILECKHRVHKTCWARMQQCCSPSCPACFEMDD